MTYRDSAPAFQEYAADLLANRNYRCMTLAERGLLQTLRLECWVSRSVPANRQELARYLGIPEDGLIAALTPGVLAFFEERNGELFAPDLERYREKLEVRRDAQAEAARRTNAKRGQTKHSTKSQESESQSGIRGDVAKRNGKRTVERTPLSRVEKSGDESKSESLTKRIVTSKDPWVDDYETTDMGMAS